MSDPIMFGDIPVFDDDSMPLFNTGYLVFSCRVCPAMIINEPERMGTFVVAVENHTGHHKEQND